MVKSEGRYQQSNRCDACCVFGGGRGDRLDGGVDIDNGDKTVGREVDVAVGDIGCVFWSVIFDLLRHTFVFKTL